MARRALLFAAVAVLMTAFAPGVSAQDRPTSAVEGLVGYAGFVDDATISHTVFGGAAKWYLLPRVSVGPELVYMIGPGDDRDLVVTGNVTFDFLAGRPAATPFLVAGGGLFRHTDRFNGRSFSSTEGSFTLGGGVRVALGERLYIAPEFRLGWEAHYRVSAAVGWRLGN
jgi:hypothetical protein